MATIFWAYGGTHPRVMAKNSELFYGQNFDHDLGQIPTFNGEIVYANFYYETIWYPLTVWKVPECH